MKKLLCLMVVGFGGALLVKGTVSVTNDNQLQIAGLTVPNPVAGSPVFGAVTTMLRQARGTAEKSPPEATQRPRPALPIVNSANGTYDGNRQGASPANGGDLGSVPPELARLMNPSALTTPPGAQNPGAAAQQDNAQSRLNPAAFKEQFGAVAKALRGTQ